jgi:hypothetical protein
MKQSLSSCAAAGRAANSQKATAASAHRAAKERLERDRAYMAMTVSGRPHLVRSPDSTRAAAALLTTHLKEQTVCQMNESSCRYSPIQGRQPHQHACDEDRGRRWDVERPLFNFFG